MKDASCRSTGRKRCGLLTPLRLQRGAINFAGQTAGGTKRNWLNDQTNGEKPRKKIEMKVQRTFLLIAVASGMAMGFSSRADDTADTIESLKQQIQALDQKVRVLERQRELEGEAAEVKARETPRITVSNNGLNVSSADTNFVFQLHGLLQVDNRSFFNDGNIQGNDTFLLRRARPIFQGTVYRD